MPSTNERAASIFLSLTLVVACGSRSGLSGFGRPEAVGGTAGGGGSGGGSGGLGATGGSLGSTGGAVGTGGAAGGGGGMVGSGGALTTGGTDACGDGCGAYEVCVEGRCECLEGAFALSYVSPPNASASEDPNIFPGATFTCPLDLPDEPDRSMALHAAFSGRQHGSFSIAYDHTLLLEPFRFPPQRTNLFFPGELLTVWVGPDLDGPYQTQARVAVTHATSMKFYQADQELGQDLELPVPGDVDRDGDLDLVFADPAGAAVWLNDGTGSFSPLAAQAPSPNLPLLLADLDADGDLDLLPDRLNDGHGQFTLGQGDTFGTLAVGDVDGDGDIDRISSGSVVLLNDGSAGFTTGTTLPLGYVRLELGDVDGDGDLDAIGFGAITTDLTTPFLCINDGSGYFYLDPQVIDNVALRDLVVGDFDGDLDLDLFTTDWGWPAKGTSYNRLWRNNAGTFENDGLYHGTVSVAAGDLNGDGDLDLAVSDDPPYSVLPGEPTRLLSNLGDGNFVDGTQRVGEDGAWIRTVLGDFDGDRDLDAFLVQASEDESVAEDGIWLNK